MTRSRRRADEPRTGREAAVRAITAALRGDGFASDQLVRYRSALDGRESALAVDLALGTLRHLITIEHVLSQLADYNARRVAPMLRAIICCGAYQLIWLDRVPAFAAVDESVKLGRLLAGARASGMVNAVLRRVAEGITERRTGWSSLFPREIRIGWLEACQFNQPVLPVPDTDRGLRAHLAAATGCRPAYFAKLAERYDLERAEAIAWACQAVPSIALFRNTLRINEAVFQARVRLNFGAHADWSPDVAYLPASANVIESDLFSEGRAFIQDTTAHFAARLLHAHPGELVLDLCAAPGGKSIVLAQDMQDRGEVVACDAAADRLVRVRENARRLRLTSIRTHLLETNDASERVLQRSFDAALVDVPCSNSGVVARRPEARLGLTSDKINSLTKLQAALLDRAAASVRKSGGRVVYSTCSIEPEENEQVVGAFLDRHIGEWELADAHTQLPQWGPAHSDWRDGGYAALLHRI